ncbi:MAG: hypothetical protein WAU42_03160 [Solirubrobacteraceae bacterium]
MSFLMVVVGFPLLLAVLALGSGLLVERIVGIRLPFVLLAPLGFGVLIVVSQFTTWPPSTTLAPLTPWILLALALLGFVLAWRGGLAERWQGRGSGWWLAPAGALAAYLTVSAPIIAAGRLTFPGYLLDTTGSIQIMGAERLLHHGREFTSGFPGYGATLVAYFGNGYPSGGHTVLGSVGWLSGQNLLWLYAPFQAAELAFAALVLAFLARSAGLSRPAAAITGWLAAVPALVYSYALMGSIKEITVLPMLLLMGACVVLAPRLARAGVRGALPFAIAGAASLGAIGIAASPWVGLFLLAVLVFAAPVVMLRRHRARALALSAVVTGGMTAVLALPTLGPLSTTLALAQNVSNTDAQAASDPGNLLRPLRIAQAFGIWLGESHRIEPRFLNQTYLVIGVVVVCTILGLLWLVRRRAWGLLAFALISLVVWEFLRRHGTEWTDAKVLMVSSPVVVLIALIGAFSIKGGRSIEGVLVAGVIALGIFGSDALAYHATGLAPTQRYTELSAIGEHFSGQGPTLLTDFDEYGLYLLREVQVDSPGYAYHGVITLDNGANPQYGHSYDIDQISQATLQQYPLLVMRRSPIWSRPPSNYSEVWSGPSWQVWRRVGPAPAVHVPLGEGSQPAAIPQCGKVRALARVAKRDGKRLVVAERPPNIVLNMAEATRSPNTAILSDLEGQPQLAMGPPARVELSFRVPKAGRYRLWFGGDIDRPLHVSIDGRQVGVPREQFGGDENKYPVAAVSLSAGKHKLTMLRGGGTLQPGDRASAVIDGGILEPLAAEEETVRSVSPSAWHSLCGHWLDWIEVS